jgi:hypothetical protein
MIVLVLVLQSKDGILTFKCNTAYSMADPAPEYFACGRKQKSDKIVQWTIQKEQTEPAYLVF